MRAVHAPISRGHVPIGHGSENPIGKLAMELHDCVMQDLWYLQAQLASLAEELPESCRESHPQIDHLKTVAQGTYEELRKILGLLKSALPPYLDLASDLDTVRRKFCETLGMQIEFSVSPPGLEAVVHKDVAHQVRLVVQEALWNAWQHGKAKCATVTMRQVESGLAIRVSDDGCGFVPDSVDEAGFGLVSMRERAQLIKGRIYVTSRLGEGTRVALLIPAEALEANISE